MTFKPKPSTKLAIKEVFYPEWVTPENYNQCRRPGKVDNFGPLFSITFVSPAASEAFYNALPCAKGPSLGTNFTLACPYTILAHYHELDWAASYGVEEGIVRISVGMEDERVLLNWIQACVEAAEATVI
jgi:cystathionine gamma-synthase